MSNPNDWNKMIIDEFRANGGKVGGQFANATLLLLNTVGAKTQQPRVNPVAYTKDGDQFVVIASAPCLTSSSAAARKSGSKPRAP